MSQAPAANAATAPSDPVASRPTPFRTAWRAAAGIPPRQWACAAAIGLALGAANVVGNIPVLAPSVPWLVPMDNLAAAVPGLILPWLAATCVALLAFRLTESPTSTPSRSTQASVLAGAGAIAAGLAVEIALNLLVPGTAGWREAPDAMRLAGKLVWSAANWGLTGGLVVAAYLRIRLERDSRVEFEAAEVARAIVARELLASRLSAMQAQVDPRFLLGTLENVDGLHDRDPRRGQRLLDALIAFLRAALPQVGSLRSTLRREGELAKCYLDVVQMRMDGQLDYSIDLPLDADAVEFPPMVLLPLLDEALRVNGPSPAARRSIDIRANVTPSRVRIVVDDDGVSAGMRSGDDAAIAAIRGRLADLYDDSARLTREAGPSGTRTTTIEIDREASRDHRRG